MFDFSQFLIDVERRARRVHGASLLAPVLCVSSLAALAYAGIAVYGTPRRPPLWTIGLVAGLPLLVALIAYLAGRRRSVDLPTLLLRIDDAVGADAALSSLFEVRRRGADSAFRRRIESRLSGPPPRWREGLPVRASLVAVTAIGVASLLAAAAVLMLPAAGVGPPPAAVSPIVTESPSSSTTERDRVAPRPAAAPPRMESDVPLQGDDPPPSEADRPPLDDRGLRDVLAELETATSDAVLGSPTDRSPERLAADEQRADRALSEFLEQLRDRLGADGLSEEDRRALQEPLGRPLPPQTRAALNDLLRADNPERAKELIDRLLAILGGTLPPEAEALGEPPASASSESDPVDDATDPFAAFETDSHRDGEPAGHGSSPPSDGADATGDRGDRADGAVDESGGNAAGSPTAPDVEERPPAGFVEEDAPATIGPDGEFREFLTRGVPIETATPGADGAIPVDYERIESILRARAVPPADWNVVRDYFDAITKGGS